MDEAFPYIAKRLITDDSPRLQAALRYMVRGAAQRGEAQCSTPTPGGPGRLGCTPRRPGFQLPRLSTLAPHRLLSPRTPQVYGRDTVFDADRLIDLLDAFETFTEASRSARGDMDLDVDPLAQVGWWE